MYRMLWITDCTFQMVQLGEDNAIHLPLELLKNCRIAINTYSMNFDHYKHHAKYAV